MIAAALIDVDGTLVDSVDLHARAWTEAFHRFGIAADYDAVRAQIGKGGDQLKPVFMTPQQLEACGEALEAYRSELFTHEYLPLVRPIPGGHALMNRLRRDGKRVVVASSAKRREVDYYMRLIGCEQLIDGSVSGEDVDRSKPFPDIFLAALELAGPVPPEAALAVGDSPWDALAARNAGVRTVGVRSGGFPDADLRAAGCIALYDDVADLDRNYCRSPFVVCRSLSDRILRWR